MTKAERDPSFIPACLLLALLSFAAWATQTGTEHFKEEPTCSKKCHSE